MPATASCRRDTRPASPSAVYQPRRPERTVAYQVIQRHLETWLALAHANEHKGNPIPWYVERDFRQYLSCGILANGFARVRCADCGQDFLVAFSCCLELETIRSTPGEEGRGDA